MRFGISTKTEDNDYCKVSSRGAEHRIRFAVTECKDFKLKLDLIVLVGIPDLDPFAFPVRTKSQITFLVNQFFTA